MSKDFDPYFEWLGIPPKHQPPDHYRLLNLDKFESDVPLIAASAQRVTARLREIPPGKHDADSRRLLKEVMVAGSCLLDEETKAKYDDSLRTTNISKRTPPADDDGELKLQALEEEPPVRQRVSRSGNVAEPPMGLVDVTGRQGVSGSHRTQTSLSGQHRTRNKQNPLVLTILLVFLLAVCGVALAVVLRESSNGDETEVADQSDSDQKSKQRKSSTAGDKQTKPKIKNAPKNSSNAPSGNNAKAPKLDGIDEIGPMPIIKSLPFAIEPDLIDEPDNFAENGDDDDDTDQQDSEEAAELWKEGRAAVGRGDVAPAIAALEKYVLHKGAKEHRAEAEQLIKEARVAIPDDEYMNGLFQLITDEQLTQLENPRARIHPPNLEFTHPILSDMFHLELRKRIPAEKKRRAEKNQKPFD